MVDTNALKGIIASRGLSHRKVANMMGISEKTFYDKMKKGVFSNLEIEALVEILSISDTINIFFAKDVASHET